MEARTFETPVVLFVFKRPDTTHRVFEAIAQIRPARLLLVADGPRPGKPGEAEACQQVRDIVGRVDWTCEVSTNFSENNLGCGERMISGLNWVFSLVEEAIILEDDCLPDASFFPFCQELLERYRGDDRIAYISGDNFVARYMKSADSYYYSRIGGTWGWATWRSEWRRYDRHLSDWPELRKQRMLEEIFDEPKAVAYWTHIFDAMHKNKPLDIWDYQWTYTHLKNNALTIVPRVNLVANIGFGEGATHTTVSDPRSMIPASSMEFPLRHPVSYIPMCSLDRRRVRYMFPPSILHRILHKIHRVASRLLQ
jgi:hypothetical protein